MQTSLINLKLSLEWSKIQVEQITNQIEEFDFLGDIDEGTSKLEVLHDTRSKRISIVDVLQSLYDIACENEIKKITNFEETSSKNSPDE